MSSIKNLEMAAAFSAYQHIEIKKSLLSTKAIYTPTQSQVKPIVLEYTPSEGERMERLLDMPLDKMAADIQEKGKPVAGANGHFRLEFCLSATISSALCSCSVSAISSTSLSSSHVSMKARMQSISRN